MRKNRLKKLKVRIETKKKSSLTATVPTNGRADRIDNKITLENKIQAAENKKLVLMRLGVAGFMIIFFIAWIFSLKYQFKTKADNKNSFNWEQTKVELDQAMGQVKKGVAEIKRTQAAKPQNTLPRPSELTAEQLNLLKGKLINETASGTASSTKK